MGWLASGIGHRPRIEPHLVLINPKPFLKVMVSLKVDHGPACRLLEGEVGHAFDENFILRLQRQRHLAPAAARP